MVEDIVGEIMNTILVSVLLSIGIGMMAEIKNKKIVFLITVFVFSITLMVATNRVRIREVLSTRSLHQVVNKTAVAIGDKVIVADKYGKKIRFNVESFRYSTERELFAEGKHGEAMLVVSPPRK